MLASMSSGGLSASTKSITNSIAQQKEFRKAVQPGSPIRWPYIHGPLILLHLSFLVPSEPANDVGTDDSPTHLVHASSLELPGFTFGPSTVTPVAPTPSSLGRSVFGPSINKGKKPSHGRCLGSP